MRGAAREVATAGIAESLRNTQRTTNWISWKNPNTDDLLYLFILFIVSHSRFSSKKISIELLYLLDHWPSLILDTCKHRDTNESMEILGIKKRIDATIQDPIVRNEARRYSMRTVLAFLPDDVIGKSFYFRILTWMYYYTFIYFHGFESERLRERKRTIVIDQTLPHWSLSCRNGQNRSWWSLSFHLPSFDPQCWNPRCHCLCLSSDRTSDSVENNLSSLKNDHCAPFLFFVDSLL